MIRQDGTTAGHRAKPSKRMRIQAVTVCINYADYLRCVVENQRHFDRWVVMTCAEDTTTQELCAKRGLECRVSKILKEDGGDFHAATAKWRVLNEGLGLLDQEGWAVILDADVLLPRHFLERVGAMPLVPGFLYGVEGRKVIEAGVAFEQGRDCEPWTRLVGRTTTIIGYFNLFHLGSLPNRYPARPPGSERGTHDDYRFFASFAEDRRATLPMTVIHTGPLRMNWSQRRTPLFECDRDGLPAGTDAGLETMWAALAARLRGKEPRAALQGYFPGGRWRRLAERCAETWLVDEFGVHAPREHPFGPADAEVLARLFARETEGLDGLRLLGPRRTGYLAGVQDEGIDLLYLPGEVSPASLAEILPAWASKLRDGAVVCGDLFGLTHWPEASWAISLLLGPPREVSREGFWWREIRKADWRLPPPRSDAELAAEEEGVVLLNRSAQTLEALTLSLQTVRKHWPGPMAVIHEGREEGALTIVCARMGVRLVQMEEETEPDAREKDWCMEALAQLPWKRGLLLHSRMLATQPLAPMLAEAGRPITGETDAIPLGFDRDRVGIWRELPCAAAETSPADAPLIWCSGDPEGWTDAAWGTWCHADAALALDYAAEIRIAREVTVVTIVSETELGDFERARLAWKFPSGTPVKIFLAGTSGPDPWLPGITAETTVARLSLEEARDLPALFQRIGKECITPRLLFLPAVARAGPGAELWPGGEGGETRLLRRETRKAEEEFTLTGNRFVPAEFALLCERQLLARVAQSDDCRVPVERWMEPLHAVAHEVPAETPEASGWQWPATHRYLPRRGEISDPVITVRRGPGGHLSLAGDVVVISLPEREDRRERIRQTMRGERVKFRVAEGVRVAEKELDPEEVAGVDWRPAKVVAGRSKFLRGVAGCRRAHLRCLEAALAAGTQSLLLIEDDMQWKDGWLERYQAAVQELPRGWLQLYLSSVDYRRSEPVTPHLHRLQGAWQTTAILYSAAGIEAAVNVLRRSRYEIDSWMGDHLHPFGCSYALRPGIAYQRGGMSDIMSSDRGVTP